MLPPPWARTLGRLWTSGPDLGEPLARASEVVRRSLGLELHDCQLQAAKLLFAGNVVQMQTGEGKTLVAMLAAICHAHCGRSTHVMTVNGYLAQRDYQALRPIYQALGLSVGLTNAGQSPKEKRENYRCDVVYGPGYEFGFDYLRDRLHEQSQRPTQLGDRVRQRWTHQQGQAHEKIQGPLKVAIVDEADSVMLDEATTPLVLAGQGGRPSTKAMLYEDARDAISHLCHGQDYHLSNQGNDFRWSDSAATRIPEPSAMAHRMLDRAWRSYLEKAIFAFHCLQRDVHYLVLDDRIQLIDQHTGRIQLDRTWSAGLQQAVEAKERVTITEENSSLATITRQRFLGLYPILSGLTGTTEGIHRELDEIYRIRVATVPTHRPSRLECRRPRIFRDTEERNRAVIASVLQCHQNARPVLVGTTSIASSERLSDAFHASGIQHRLLSGRQDREEAEIVAAAGQSKAVTIATNIAGRGTDIRLEPGVAQRGGLHVIATELYASLRVERQMMGRAARQGDPGSFESILSVDDRLLEQAAPELSARIRRSIDASQLDRMDWMRELRALQERCEALRRQERRDLFAADDWKNSIAKSL